MSKNFPKIVKAVLIDICGTMCIDNVPTPKAVEALAKLRTIPNLHLKLVTNCVKESNNDIFFGLRNMGFTLHRPEIYSSLTAVSCFVKEKNLNPFYILPNKVAKEFPNSDKDKEYDAVVVGLAPYDGYYEYRKVAIKILIKKCPLISIHSNTYYKQKDARKVRMAGYFIKGLENVALAEAMSFGKPSPLFYTKAVPPQVTPEECIMIGDNIYDDVRGSMKVGMNGFLVKTGKYSGTEVITPPPSNIFNNFAEAVDYIIENMRVNPTLKI